MGFGLQRYVKKTDTMEASQKTMDAIECIKSRQSIRAFKREEVDNALLREVLDAATWSPSYKNTQPWEVIVVSGQKKKDLSKHMIDLFESGEEPTPDLPAPTSWPQAEQARIDHLFAMRKEAMGIDLADPEIVKKSKKANFNFYFAPHAVYMLQDASLSQWSLFDIGLFTQTFMLAANAKGLGSVPQAFATDYAKQIKEFLGIPASKRLVLGLSVGYPDWDSPANKLRTDRSGLDEIVKWME